MSTELSAYEIALIGGGFTIVGTFLGAWITHYFALQISKQGLRQQAAQKLIAEFSQELALLDPSNSLGEKDVERLLSSRFNQHYMAVLEFAQHLKPVEREQLMVAWRTYYQVGGSVRFFEYYMNENPYQVFKERIGNILAFAST